MAATPGKVIVVGAGIFGVTAALALRRRGYAVSLFDPGPLPHPDASSTDISKAIRMDYGSDEFYMALMEVAFEGWHAWNGEWGRVLYHEEGWLFLARDEMRPGGFEYDSYQLLLKRGHSPQRLDSQMLGHRFPAWAAKNYADGYFNPKAGWVESGAVVSRLIGRAQAAGVQLYEGHSFERLLEDGSKVGGIRTTDGESHGADVVVVAAGAWTPTLLPHLQDVMWAVGQPVFHFKVAYPADFQAPHFVGWGGDIGNTGWYGFSASDDGTLKIANHGPGLRVHPGEPRVVEPQWEGRFRDFLRETFPAASDAPVIKTRLCLYCDTFDGDFWIGRDPHREGLIIATGGSGHGFKFAPVLGRLIADVVERKANRFSHRFAWRERGALASEDARHGA